MNKNKIRYKYVTSGVFESLLRDYNSDKNNSEYINNVIDYIFSNNSYSTVMPKDNSSKYYYDFKIINYLLNNYQEDLDYNIVSRLLYKEIDMFNLIKEDHKDYQQLKELYEFLTI
jgi:hypothetical protein